MDSATECLPMKHNHAESGQTAWALGPFRSAASAQGTAAATTGFPT